MRIMYQWRIVSFRIEFCVHHSDGLIEQFGPALTADGLAGVF
jgi:hypothetical protein